ncbi:MAG: hypothetical protein ABIP20_15280 [Chthoniobacteraceae bacterium]
MFAFTLVLAIVAGAVAEPPILTEPRRPFAFTPGGSPAEVQKAAVGEKVWSAVVLASNARKGERPAAVPAELAPFASKLTNFLGCNQLELLGSATKAMDGQTERWLVPTQNFWVGAKATREHGGYRVNMEFFHDKRPLLTAEVMLGPGSPVFVTGPKHARGQIIMVFEVKR